MKKENFLAELYNLDDVLNLILEAYSNGDYTLFAKAIEAYPYLLLNDYIIDVDDSEDVREAKFSNVVGVIIYRFIKIFDNVFVINEDDEDTFVSNWSFCYVNTFGEVYCDILIRQILRWRDCLSVDAQDYIEEILQFKTVGELEAFLTGDIEAISGEQTIVSYSQYSLLESIEGYYEAVGCVPLC